ncbi:MAG: hypothetical protein WC607_01725 [Candidatus Micrarchaeia archaeon]
MNKALLLVFASLAFAGCLDDGAGPSGAPLGVFELHCYTNAPLNPGFARVTQANGIGVTQCVVKNGVDAGNYIFSVEIPEWSEKAEQTVYLAENEVRSLDFTLTFKNKFYDNREFQPVTVRYAAEKDGTTIYTETQAANVTSGTQMIFGGVVENETFFFPFVAVQWVTPNDPCIEGVISAAKELMPGRAFSDYQGYAGKSDEEKAALTMEQAKAVYDTLQAHGMSYVNSVGTFGDPTLFSQNVRLPHESLATKNANCIDGTVLYAAVFEKIGLEPIIIIVPGHAFVAVRNDRNSSSVTFIETTATGTKSFEEAAYSAEQTYFEQIEGMQAGDNASMAVTIDVAVARSLGVAPFPATNSQCEVNITVPSYSPGYTPDYSPAMPTMTCSDGTGNYQCSTTQPLACIGGILFPDCFDCGCPAGSFCYYDGSCYN